MLSIPGSNVHCCDGPTRREFLRVGGATLFGLSLPHFLSLKALASANAANGIQRGKPFGNAKSVILLFLQGGPSHLDIWDPKPNAPSNIRGEFKPIKTKVDGIQVSEPNDAWRLPASVLRLPWPKLLERLQWIIWSAQPSCADANQSSLDQVVVEQVDPSALRMSEMN